MSHACPPIPPTSLSTCSSFKCQAFVPKIAAFIFPWLHPGPVWLLSLFLRREFAVGFCERVFVLFLLPSEDRYPHPHPFPPQGCCVVSKHAKLPSLEQSKCQQLHPAAGTGNLREWVPEQILQVEKRSWFREGVANTFKEDVAGERDQRVASDERDAEK